MTDTAFRPTLYLLDPCPFCFKVRVFLMEAGLTEKVEIRSFGQGEEMEAVRAELAPHLSKISFPAAELEPGRFVAESDDIIAFLAKGSGQDPAAMPNLRIYVDGPLQQIRTLWQENQVLKASAA